MCKSVTRLGSLQQARDVAGLRFMSQLPYLAGGGGPLYYLEGRVGEQGRGRGAARCMGSGQTMMPWDPPPHPPAGCGTFRKSLLFPGLGDSYTSYRGVRATERS